MCPNIGECFVRWTATFMIMGGICTRRCAFCDVAHGRPQPLDEREPDRLAEAVAALGLRYVVVTSVDRDDLRDGGAAHFARCVASLRERVPGIRVEVLTPDFRGRVERALLALSQAWPDVFNHNIETVPSLYRAARAGADYRGSLELLLRVKQANEAVLTKSGLMGRTWRVGSGTARHAARFAHTSRRYCDDRPVSRAVAFSYARAPVCGAGAVCFIARAGGENGLSRSRRRAAGAFVISRGPGGRCGNGGDCMKIEAAVTGSFFGL